MQSISTDMFHIVHGITTLTTTLINRLNLFKRAGVNSTIPSERHMFTSVRRHENFDFHRKIMSSLGICGSYLDPKWLVSDIHVILRIPEKLRIILKTNSVSSQPNTKQTIRHAAPLDCYEIFK